MTSAFCWLLFYRASGVFYCWQIVTEWSSQTGPSRICFLKISRSFLTSPSFALDGGCFLFAWRKRRNSGKGSAVQFMPGPRPQSIYLYLNNSLEFRSFNQWSHKTSDSHQWPVTLVQPDWPAWLDQCHCTVDDHMHPLFCSAQLCSTVRAQSVLLPPRPQQLQYAIGESVISMMKIIPLEATSCIANNTGSNQPSRLCSSLWTYEL